MTTLIVSVLKETLVYSSDIRHFFILHSGMLLWYSQDLKSAVKGNRYKQDQTFKSISENILKALIDF